METLDDIYGPIPAGPATAVASRPSLDDIYGPIPAPSEVGEILRGSRPHPNVPAALMELYNPPLPPVESFAQPAPPRPSLDDIYGPIPTAKPSLAGPLTAPPVNVMADHPYGLEAAKYLAGQAVAGATLGRVKPNEGEIDLSPVGGRVKFTPLQPPEITQEVEQAGYGPAGVAANLAGSILPVGLVGRGVAALAGLAKPLTWLSRAKGLAVPVAPAEAETVVELAPRAAELATKSTERAFVRNVAGAAATGAGVSALEPISEPGTNLERIAGNVAGFGAFGVAGSLFSRGVTGSWRRSMGQLMTIFTGGGRVTVPAEIEQQFRAEIGQAYREAYDRALQAGASPQEATQAGTRAMEPVQTQHATEIQKAAQTQFETESRAFETKIPTDLTLEEMADARAKLVQKVQEKLAAQARAARGIVEGKVAPNKAEIAGDIPREPAGVGPGDASASTQTQLLLEALQDENQHILVAVANSPEMKTLLEQEAMAAEQDNLLRHVAGRIRLSTNAAGKVMEEERPLLSAPYLLAKRGPHGEPLGSTLDELVTELQDEGYFQGTPGALLEAILTHLKTGVPDLLKSRQGRMAYVAEQMQSTNPDAPYAALAQKYRENDAQIGALVDQLGVQAQQGTVGSASSQGETPSGGSMRASALDDLKTLMAETTQQGNTALTRRLESIADKHKEEALRSQYGTWKFAAIRHVAREGDPLVFVDLDHLGAINTLLGDHALPDVVLTGLMDHFKVEFGDRLYKHGGDEYVIVPDPALRLDQIREKLRRVRQWEMQYYLPLDQEVVVQKPGEAPQRLGGPGDRLRFNFTAGIGRTGPRGAEGRDADQTVSAGKAVARGATYVSPSLVDTARAMQYTEVAKKEASDDAQAVPYRTALTRGGRVPSIVSVRPSGGGTVLSHGAEPGGGHGGRPAAPAGGQPAGGVVSPASGLPPTGAPAPGERSAAPADLTAPVVPAGDAAAALAGPLDLPPIELQLGGQTYAIGSVPMAQVPEALRITQKKLTNLQRELDGAVKAGRPTATLPPQIAQWKQAQSSLNLRGGSMAHDDGGLTYGEVPPDLPPPAPPTPSELDPVVNARILELELRKQLRKRIERIVRRDQIQEHELQALFEQATPDLHTRQPLLMNSTQLQTVLHLIAETRHDRLLRAERKRVKGNLEATRQRLKLSDNHWRAIQDVVLGDGRRPSTAADEQQLRDALDLIPRDSAGRAILAGIPFKDGTVIDPVFANAAGGLLDLFRIELNLVDSLRAVERLEGTEYHDVVRKAIFDPIDNAWEGEYEFVESVMDRLEAVHGGAIQAKSLDSTLLFRVAEGRAEVPADHPLHDVILNTARWIRQTSDDLRNAMNVERAKSGLRPIAFRPNYMTHLWEQSAVQQLAGSLVNRRGDDIFLASEKAQHPNTPFNPTALERQGAPGFVEDAITVFRRYVMTAAKELYYGPAIRQARRHVTHLPKVAQIYFTRYLDAMAGKKELLDQMAALPFWMLKSMRWLRTRYTGSLLSYSLSFWLNNLSNLVFSLGELGPRWLLYGSTKFLLSEVSHNKAFARSRALRSRRYEPITQDPVTGWTKQATEDYVTKYMEYFNVGSTYVGAYHQGLEMGLSESEAVRRADTLAGKLQTMYERHRVNVVTRTRILDFISPFQTWAWNALNYVLYDLLRVPHVLGQAVRTVSDALEHTESSSEIFRRMAVETMREGVKQGHQYNTLRRAIQFFVGLTVINTAYEKAGVRAPYGVGSFFPTLPIPGLRGRYETPITIQIPKDLYEIVSGELQGGTRESARAWKDLLTKQPFLLLAPVGGLQLYRTLVEGRLLPPLEPEHPGTAGAVKMTSGR